MVRRRSFWLRVDDLLGEERGGGSFELVAIMLKL